MKLNKLQKFKVQQLAIEELFNGQEPEEYYRYLMEYFNDDEDEVKDLLRWRKEDKKYFIYKLKELLELVETSEVEENE